MTSKQRLIVIQMGSDKRIPVSAVGYVDDLSRDCSPRVLADRLNQLRRFVPELVKEFETAGQ